MILSGFFPGLLNFIEVMDHLLETQPFAVPKDWDLGHILDAHRLSRVRAELRRARRGLERGGRWGPSDAENSWLNWEEVGSMLI